MVTHELGGRAYTGSLVLSDLLQEEDRPDINARYARRSVIFRRLFVAEIVSVDHAKLLCDHLVSQLIFRRRFLDTDFLDTRDKVSERASLPSVWRTKLNKLLMERIRLHFDR